MAVNMGRYFFLGLPRSVVACSYACPGSLITALFPLWPVSLPVTSVGFLSGDNNPIIAFRKLNKKTIFLP